MRVSWSFWVPRYRGFAWGNERSGSIPDILLSLKRGNFRPFAEAVDTLRAESKKSKRKKGNRR